MMRLSTIALAMGLLSASTATQAKMLFWPRDEVRGRFGLDDMA